MEQNAHEETSDRVSCRMALLCSERNIDIPIESIMCCGHYMTSDDPWIANDPSGQSMLLSLITAFTYVSRPQ